MGFEINEKVSVLNAKLEAFMADFDLSRSTIVSGQKCHEPRRSFSARSITPR